MKRRVHGYGLMPIDDNVATNFTIDFTTIGVDLTRRWRVVRTGWVAAFSTLDDADPPVVSQSTTYPPPGLGDWRALYHLRWGAVQTEGLIVPWYYPIDRDDLLPATWDGRITVAGGDPVLGFPWGTTTASPVIWVDIRAVRQDELQEELAGCS